MGTRPSIVRAAIDTNVLVSGLFWGGVPNRIMQSIALNQFEFVTSRGLIQELRRVLTYPKFQPLLASVGTNRLETLFSLVSAARRVDAEQFMVDLIPNEPIDNELIAVALTAQVDAIISGDRHLLGVRDLIQIPVLTPSLFVKRFM